MKTSSKYICQLYATYPTKSSQLLSSSTSNVSIYADRVLSSVYMNNGTQLFNPTSLFLNNTDPWIPVFKLYAGNNESFLWFNSSNSTTLIDIPKIIVNQTTSHWYSILISQWNKGSYRPNQVAIAFIINRTRIIDFLIFNASGSDILSWFSITRLISNTYWSISSYAFRVQAQTYVKSIYTDTNCIRSFNCNYKPYPTLCTSDFYGFFFVYGGYRDACIAAVQNLSTVSIPSIYYSPNTNSTNSRLTDFNIADSLMVFVR